MAAFYNNGKKKLWDGSIDLDTDTIKIAFMAPGYTPNIDTEDFYDDISASVASGSTDQTLANKTLTIDTTNNIVKFDADDISLAAQTILGGTNKIVVYKSSGVASSSPLIAYVDITEGTLAPVNGTLTITWGANGIFYY